MDRKLSPLIVMLVSCFGVGCDSRPDDSEKAAVNEEQVARPPGPGPLKEDPAPLVETDPEAANLHIDSEFDHRDYLSFPAIGVKIVRPKDFIEAEDFHGFLQRDTQSSVMALKIPGPYSEISAGFDAEEMKKRGLDLKSREQVEISGVTGTFLSLTQEAYGTEFSKWIVVFGNEKETTMVTATYPTSEKERLSAELKASVLSTKIDDTPPPAPGEDLGFTIKTSDKLGGMREVGKMLLCTKSDAVPVISPEDPMFIVGPSVAIAPIKDRAQFAQQRLMETAQTKTSAITSNKTITIDRLDGYEIIARAEDADTEIPLTLYQVILFKEDGSYFLMQGLVGEKLSPEYLPEFKAMARSFRRKQAK